VPGATPGATAAKSLRPRELRPWLGLTVGRRFTAPDDDLMLGRHSYCGPATA